MTFNLENPIWVLGTKIKGIKSFDWLNDKLDNFGDCGTLIVDMRSLTNSTLYLLTSNRLSEIQEQVKKRFIAGGSIICVLDERREKTTRENFIVDNEFWSPISFSPRKTNPGQKFTVPDKFGFQNYISKIKSWEIQIQQTIENNNPKSRDEILKIPAFSVLTTGDNGIIGGIFKITSSVNNSGWFFALPKLDDNEENTIQRILHDLGVFEETPPPDWTNSIELPGTQEIKTKISDFENKIEKLHKEKQREELNLENLEKYKKLLYATDKELEQIIIESLSLLGFSNVREGRSPEKEDVLFDFNLSDPNLAVIEVKGKGKSVDLADFRQTDDWAWDYRNEGNKVKAILVANCFRLEDPNTTLSQRMNFEPHREYFEQHKIAVLPTWTLFKLVEYKLDGNTIDIKNLEQIFSSTNDVIKPENVID